MQCYQFSLFWLLKIILFFSEYYAFGENNNKFYIHSSTLKLFNEKTCLDEVHLALYNQEKTSHSEVQDALRRHNIDFVVVGLTNAIFVRNCDWQTLDRLYRLSYEVSCGLKVSGGEIKISSSGFKNLTTSTHPKCNKRNAFRVTRAARARTIKCAIIDTGCSQSLYDEIGQNRLHKHMLVPRTTTTIEGGKICKTVDMTDGAYDDPFVDTQGNWGHGTGVVETFLQYPTPNVQTRVVSLGSPMLPSHLNAALAHLLVEGVDIINCSFTIGRSM